MLGIKNLAQLSLSRTTSQPPTHRTSPDSTRPLADSTVPEPIGRPTCHDDYYLSDDQLVLPQRSNHFKAYNPVSRPDHVKSSLPPTYNLAITPVSNPPTAKGSVKPNKLAIPIKSQALISASATTSVMNGQPTQTSPQATHKNLISNLRSVSAKQFPNTTRNATPISSRPGSPPCPNNSNTSPTSAHPITMHQLEASYVSKVGARLQALIDQVFLSTTENNLAWMGRAAPRPSYAAEVAKALQHELDVCSCDLYIFRSMLRTAAIPALTVFAGRLHSLLILPANEASVLHAPRSAKVSDNCLPIALRYNIEVIRCAWLAYSSVGHILKAKEWSPEISKVLRDALTPFISKMDAVIQQFMGPYLLEIKKQATSCILKCQIVESSAPLSPKGHHPLGRTIPSLGGYAGWSTPTHLPEPLRELANLLEGIRKLLMVKVACGAESNRWMVSLATHVVWKGMLVFATSAFPLPTSRAQQGSQPSRNPPTASVTHFIDSYSSAFGLKGAKNILHPGKRSPSPPMKPVNMVLHHELLYNLKVFTSLIHDFVKDIVGLEQNSQKVELTCVSECELCNQGFFVNPGGDGDLVQEAMKEALEALSALQLVVSSLLQPSRLRASLIACAQSLGLGSSLTNVQGADEPQLACPRLMSALQELPPFILIHLIASRISKQAGFRLPHEVWGDSWTTYQEELKGFVAAERWLPEVAHEMVKEVRRIRKLEQKIIDAANDETNKCSGDNHHKLDGLADDMEWMNLLMLSIQIFVAG